MFEEGHKIRKNNPKLLIALTYSEVFCLAAAGLVLGLSGLVVQSSVVGVWTGLITFSSLCLFWRLLDYVWDRLGWSEDTPGNGTGID